MMQRVRVPGPLGTSPNGNGGRAPGPLGIGASTVLFAAPAAAQAAQQRAGTQVLYVRPKDPPPQKKDKTEYRFEIATPDGRKEYEDALAKHLKDKGVLSGTPSFEPLSSSADIANLASNKFANLVLIVHSAFDAPAIAVDLGDKAAGIKPDWIDEDKFAPMIAPFGFASITILGCDSVSNKFAPNLAKHLPKGSTVTGHAGGEFEIKRHFDFDKKTPGHLQLMYLYSNLRLKTFPTEGKP
jgi:hypothetical protein